MTRYTITPRPQHRDVLLQCDGGETLIVRHEGVPMIALDDRARRIAALLDGRAEAVIAAARRVLPMRTTRPEVAALMDALDAYDGGTDG